MLKMKWTSHHRQNPRYAAAIASTWLIWRWLGQLCCGLPLPSPLPYGGQQQRSRTVRWGTKCCVSRWGGKGVPLLDAKGGDGKGYWCVPKCAINSDVAYRTRGSLTSFFCSVPRAIFWYDSSSHHEIVPQNCTCLFQFFFNRHGLRLPL